MTNTAEYQIVFNVSQLDAVGRIILEEGWLIPMIDKLKLLSFMSDRYDFTYKIDGENLTLSLKAPEKDIDKLAQKLIKTGTNIIKKLTK